MKDVSLRSLATGVLVALTFAACDAVRPPPSDVVIDRPPVELPQAPDFDSVFPSLPRPTMAGTEPCAVWPDTECTMGPGHYYSTEFHVAFDLPSGTWTNTVNWPNALALTDGRRSITFMSGPPGRCWPPISCRLGWPEPDRSTPAALRAEIARDSFMATSPKLLPTAIGGRSATAFDVDSLVDPEDPGGWARLVLPIQSGRYWLDQGQTARLQFLEIDGEMVVVIVEARTESFDASLAQLQPVLDSVRFEDFR